MDKNSAYNRLQPKNEHKLQTHNMSDDQDLALKKCVLEEFAPRTKDATLSTATTCGMIYSRRE